jgi:hypothetical protein
LIGEIARDTVHNKEVVRIFTIDQKKEAADMQKLWNSRRSLLLLPVVLLAVALLALACGGDGEGGEEATATEPTTRTIYMEAVEPKGTTSVEKEPFPTQALPEGGGYGLKEPDDKGNWVVETYTWAPDQIVVFEGDTVNLEIVGINGERHDSSIEGHVDSFVVERGKLTSLSFVAGAPGVYKITCTNHQPAMTGELVVLPRL